MASDGAPLPCCTPRPYARPSPGVHSATDLYLGWGRHYCSRMSSVPASPRRRAGPGIDVAWRPTPLTGLGHLLAAVTDDPGAGLQFVPPPPSPPSSSRTASSGDGPSSPNPELQRVGALVELAQRGDREAYAELYDRYVDVVYRYLHYRTGSRSLAEDLTSETFLRALRRLDSFVWQDRDIAAWFLAIARNLVLDHYKSASYRLEVSTADMLDADHPDSGIEDAVVSTLEAAALLGAVRRLKTDQQECLVLRFLQGMSVAETAAVMGRSEGAIKQLQLRAVRVLARQLPARSG